MVFSSMIFLWLFMPIVLVAYWGLGERISINVSNIILLVASLLFYAWGEPIFVVLMVSSAFINYLSALFIEKFSSLWHEDNATKIHTCIQRYIIVQYIQYYI